jgi:hypothetical protein
MMPTTTAGSVTLVVRGIRGGDDGKVTPLWARYFERLTHHANKYLRWNPRLVAEDEEVAASTLSEFCNGLANGKFEYIDKREVLWGTLARIIERKALQRLRGNRWKKEVLFTDLQPAGPPADDGSTRVAIFEPTAPYREHVSLELKEMIDRLPNPLWQQAARMVMEGYTVPEIAAQQKRTRRCVYKWLEAIEAIWKADMGRENLLG